MLLWGGELIRNQEVLNVRMAIREDPGVDCRTLDSAKCKEVAAILLYDNVGAVKDIFFLSLRCGELRRINDTHST